MQHQAFRHQGLAAATGAAGDRDCDRGGALLGVAVDRGGGERVRPR